MKSRQPLPETLDEVCIEGEWAKNLDGERFLLFETSGSERIIGFATDKMLELLCDGHLAIMDGTFRVSPLLFFQLYTFHGQYQGRIMSFMYVLMPNK